MESSSREDPFKTVPVDEPSNLPATTALAGFGGLPVGQIARQIRTQYITAMSVEHKRDLAEVEREFLLECAQLGSQAYYSWAVGGDHGKDVVEGPSINLALAMVRCWGNCAIEPQPLERDGEDAWIFTVAFIDLQKGVTFKRQFRQDREWRVFGRFDEHRKQDIRFQIGMSKAIRNVALDGLPKWLVNRGMEKAKQGERDKIEAYIKRHGMEAAQEAILGMLAEVEVPVDRVLARIGRPTKAAITIEDMVRLRGDLTALQLGAELAINLFPPVGSPAPGNGEIPDGDPATAEAKAHLRRRAAAQGNSRREPPAAAENAAPQGPGELPAAEEG